MSLHNFINTRKTLNELIKARGFNLPYVITNLDQTGLSQQYHTFLENKKSTILNIFHQERVHDITVTVTIFFIKDYPDINKVISKYQSENQPVETDQLIIVICKLEQIPLKYYLESETDQITLFSFHTLQFNPLQHRLVPIHKRLNKKQAIQILNHYQNETRENPLPLINRFSNNEGIIADPISRFLGLHGGEVVEIIRTTPTVGKHRLFRMISGDSQSPFVLVKQKLKKDAVPEIKTEMVKTQIVNKANFNDYTITLTFGDCGENHAGMQEIGKKGEEGSGFTPEMLRGAENYFQDKGYQVEYHDLSAWNLPAGILIVRNYLKKENCQKLFTELTQVEWDTKYYDTRRSKVLNKLARSNICLEDGVSQTADFNDKKGTIIDTYSVPLFAETKTNMIKDINTATDTDYANNLICEGNMYEVDRSSYRTGIGWHGDKERYKVIAIRLGKSMSMNWNWFHYSKPVGKIYNYQINSGDLYIMSELAVGTNFKKSSIYSLHHSAGHKSYTVDALLKKSRLNINKKKEETKDDIKRRETVFRENLKLDNINLLGHQKQNEIITYFETLDFQSNIKDIPKIIGQLIDRENYYVKIYKYTNKHAPQRITLGEKISNPTHQNIYTFGNWIKLQFTDLQNNKYPTIILEPGSSCIYQNELLYWNMSFDTPTDLNSPIYQIIFSYT